jgi:RhtB (resistance to homoserine/threonine) family protein
MSPLALLLSLFGVDMLAAMTPGPNFIVVAQSAAQGSSRHGACVVAGILVANIAWCLAVVLGLSALLDLAPSLYQALKILGGAYLLYLGVSLWRTRPRASGEFAPVPLSAGQAFVRGLLTNLTNPKSLAYFGSVFVLFTGPQTPLEVKAAAIGIVLVDTVLCYGAVALLFSRRSMQRLYARLERPIDRLAGAVMILFGGRLLLVRD